MTGPLATPAVARRVAAAALAVLLDPAAAGPAGQRPLPGHGEIVLIVGPEGGVSPAEAAALAEAGRDGRPAGADGAALVVGGRGGRGARAGGHRALGLSPARRAADGPSP